MRGMNKNTMKAIKHRQRGTEGHRGAFWSRGSARSEIIGLESADRAIMHMKTFKPITTQRKRGILERAKTALTVCPFFVAVD